MSQFDALRKAWPGVELSEEHFRAEWRRLADSTDAGPEIHAADLYLALAARAGNTAALSTLKALVREQVAALTNFALNDEQKDELAAQTMALLLVGAPPGGQPKLAQYSARGPLAGWLHVLMSRLWLDRRRGQKPEVEFDDEALMGGPTPAANPELELLKERFRGQFSAAFRAAMGRLTPRERNLLRQHYLDDLSLEDLGTLYRVHRVTVSRWLGAARLSLLEKTRDEIAQRVGLGRLEVDSVMRVVVSRLDLSASLFLGQEPGR